MSFVSFSAYSHIFSVSFSYIQFELDGACLHTLRIEHVILMSRGSGLSMFEFIWTLSVIRNLH